MNVLAKKRIGRGFTIVELLIVVVVIAILAAITIVAYNGITNQGNITATEADLSNLSKAQEVFRVQNGTSFSDLDEMKEAGAGSLERKASWQPEDEDIGGENLSTSTPKGRYLLSYSAHTSNINIDGTTYPNLNIEVFAVGYWDYQANKWVEKRTIWFGDIKKSEYVNDQFGDDQSSGRCVTATFEQCRRVSY